jgi:hypothetical protein
MTAPQQLAEHFNSTLRRLRSYLQYIGIVKHAKAIETLQQRQEINLT